MRRRAITTWATWLLLPLLLGVDLGARDLVLCVAPNDHVAVEDAPSFSRCHSTVIPDSSAASDRFTALADFGSSCRDSIVLESALQLRSSEEPRAAAGPIAAAIAAISPAPALRVARNRVGSSPCRSDVPARQLGSVILLI